MYKYIRLLANHRTWLFLCLIYQLTGLTVIASAQSPTTASDLKTFHAGVTTIGVTGVPGPIAVFGEKAFAVACDASPATNPIVAATRLGKGRIVVFGHDGFLNPASCRADAQRIVLNAVAWAAQSDGKVPPKALLRGVDPLASALTSTGWPTAPAAKLPKISKGVVLVVGVDSLSTADLPAVQAFVEAGGGLITASPGWGWLSLHPGLSLDHDLPINRLLAVAGLAIADGTVNKPQGAETFPVITPSPYTNASAALTVLERFSQENNHTTVSANGAIIAGSLRRLRGSVPRKFADPLHLRASRVAKALTARSPLPTISKPIGEKDEIGRLLLGLTTQVSLEAPPESVFPHPAASEFPGAVPASAKRVTKTVTLRVDPTGYICNGAGVSAKADHWHGTGLYAPPGQVITVTLPSSAVRRGLAIRVGCHADQYWDKPIWRRAPEVSRVIPATDQVTKVANPFGGLVYVVTPVGLKLGEIQVTIADAVEAPRYVLGQTTSAEWAAMRNLSAPWAELESRKLVLSVPSHAIRKVDDPAALMTFWDTVLDHCADLTAVSRERGRAERFVYDVPMGQLHSGYPMVAPVELAPLALDPVRMAREGAWGFFHELGHNHQQPAWTFDGTIEVTCNLYSLYCSKQMFPQAPLHDLIHPDAIRRHTIQYREGGLKFTDWKKEPFLALIMYMQMAEGLGWETYKKAFAAYHHLPPGQQPKSDDDKRDIWLKQMSYASGKNLGPFFQAWGVPISDKAKAEVSTLAPWNYPDAAK